MAGVSNNSPFSLLGSSPYGAPPAAPPVFPMAFSPPAVAPAAAGNSSDALLVGVLPMIFGLIQQLIVGTDPSAAPAPAPSGPAPSNETPEETDDPEESDGTSRKKTKGKKGKNDPPEITDDPNTNSGALAILNEYSDQIPTKKGGFITKKDLLKFVKSEPEDVPQEVLDAADTIANDDTMYQMLVFKSGSKDLSKGFKVKTLDTNWEKQGFDDVDERDADTEENMEDAMKILKDNAAALDALDPALDISIDDLKEIANGKGKGKLKKQEVILAAQKIMLDKDVLDELDAKDESDDAKKSDGIIRTSAFQKWINDNA